MQVPPNTLTTERFGAQFINKISTYTTEKTFSWIVSQPLNTHYTGYFLNEFFTQLITALCLSCLFLLTAKLELAKTNKQIRANIDCAATADQVIRLIEGTGLFIGLENIDTFEEQFEKILQGFIDNIR